MKLRKIMLGALLLCNCRLANSAGAASKANVPSPSYTSDLFLAQITPDNSLGTESSTVVPDIEVRGVPADLIEGGAERGANLFHSFEEFNIGDGQNVYFDNPGGIANIFSRVTGSDISNIMGTLGVDGGADLFLINPNGIIFGENASLDINGSFTASTADSILFSNDEFSASDPSEPPLLTVNMPVGLNLGNNSGDIVNRSTVSDGEANPIGLSVSAGNNLSLIGGDIQFEGGNATAKGGKIELGGLSTAGTIEISNDGNLTFPEDIAKADLVLNSGAKVDVRSVGAGSIAANAKNLSLRENSELRAGIDSESTTSDARAGDINLNLSESLNLDNSNITNTVQAEGVGNAGDINIATGTVEAKNRGQIDTNTFGNGNGGNVNLDATGDITFDGENENLESGITSLVLPGAEGDAGNITISSEGKLAFTNGGRVDASTIARGNGGNITINAKGDIVFDGEDLEQLGSGAISLANQGAEGDAGNIIISTEGNLALTNQGRVDASTDARGNGGNITIDAKGDITFEGEKNDKGFESGVASQVGEGVEGNAGNITVSVRGNLNLNNEVRIDTTSNGLGDAGDITVSVRDNLSINNGGQINANINGRGNGGNIAIDAQGNIAFDGQDSNNDGSGVTSLVGTGVEGDAGNITIATEGKLSLTNGGRIDVSSNKGRGNAGLIDITAADDILFAGEDLRTFGSGVTSQVNPGIEQGNSGGITIFTQGDLTLKDGGRVDTSTNARGNAGFVDITVLGDITFVGRALNGEGSGVTSQVNPQATGNAGRVTISTQGDLTLRDGGRIDVSINTQGEVANTNITNNENRSPTAGNANIDLQVAENIFLDSNSLISAKALGNADGGNLNINTGFIVAVPNSNSDIIASAQQGQGGNISINARSIFGIEERPLNDSTNDINASSEFNSSGTVEIDVLETNPSQDSLNLPVAPIETEVAQICDLNNNRNGLVVTGRGGVPNSPEANLDGGFALEDWRIDDASSGSGGRSLSTQSVQDIETTKPIIEADSWQVNQQGKVVLVAANNYSQSSNTTPSSTDCVAN